MSGSSEENRQPDSKNLEQRSHELWLKICWSEVKGDDAVPEILAFALSVQRETREADAKIAADVKCQADGSAKGEAPSLRSSDERSAEAWRLIETFPEYADPIINEGVVLWNTCDGVHCIHPVDLMKPEWLDLLFDRSEDRNRTFSHWMPVIEPSDARQIALRQIEEARSADTATAEHQSANLTSEISRLREALKPFAEFADICDEKGVGVHVDVIRSDLPPLDVNWFRLARSTLFVLDAALSPQEAPAGQGEDSV